MADENKLGEVIINGEDFSAYSDIFTLDTMTWQEEPSRALDGSMPDINEIERFPVPRVWIDFSLMPIEDYRRLLSALNRDAEFPVTYRNLETGQMVTHMMYVHPLDRYKIHNRGPDLIGINGVKITLVGTLNNPQTYSVAYAFNGASGTPKPTQTAQYGQVITIEGPDDWVYENMQFFSWNTKPDGTGIRLVPGQKYVVTSDIILYAIWMENKIRVEVMDITEPTTIRPSDYIPAEGYEKYYVFYIRRLEDVSVIWEGVTSWAYDEIALLPKGKIQRVQIETFDGQTFFATAGDYYTEIGSWDELR